MPGLFYIFMQNGTIQKVNHWGYGTYPCYRVGVVMRFVTLYPRAKNVQLVKDMGLIPYYIRTLFNEDAELVTYKNDESYPYLDTVVKGAKVTFIKKVFGRQIDGCIYLIKNSKKIDVLNIYHLNMSTFLYEIIYRLLNRKGKIYLKLDISMEGLRTVQIKDPRGFIKRMDIKMADIVSCETRVIQKRLNELFDKDIIYVTNGCLMQDGKATELSDAPESSLLTMAEGCNTEKTILTVAKFGTKEKASDTLLYAFAKSAERHDYKLKIIGTVEKDFEPVIEKFFVDYPDMKDRVIFAGEIHEREKLKEEYRKARVFTLPSRQESFGIVLVEAAYEGCYLVTTEATAAGYDVSDNGRYGSIVKTDNIENLSEAFVKICTDEGFDWDKHARDISEYSKSVFNWERIVTDLYDEIKKIL